MFTDNPSASSIGIYFGAPHGGSYLEGPPAPRLLSTRQAVLMSDDIVRDQQRATAVAQPRWLGNVQRRIADSVQLHAAQSGDGETISPIIALNALQFFFHVAYLLPSEPFLYASQLGDLVAEARGNSGDLTVVVTSESAIVFADGESFHEKSTIPLSDFATARGSIKTLTDMVQSGSHGEAMGA